MPGNAGGLYIQTVSQRHDLKYVPMDSKIKTIINAVVVIVVVIWLLQAFGVLGALHDVRIR
jgi:hypothetical protein